MCSQVSWVKVTCAPPCPAFMPLMQAWTLTRPFWSSPMRMPQTSVLMEERACWRIDRITPVDISTTGSTPLLFDLLIYVLPERSPQPPLLPILAPHPRRSDIQSLSRQRAPRIRQTKAARVYPMFAHRTLLHRCIHVGS